MKAKEILIVLALITTIGIVSAQNNKTTATKSEVKKECYVDANKNNVCDKNENKTCTVGNGKGLRDGSGNGQGLRNGKGRRNGTGNCKSKGANFVDANNNGVCDNRETTK